MFFKSKRRGLSGGEIPSPAMYYSQVPALMPQVIEVNIPRAAIDDRKIQSNEVDWKWLAIGGAAVLAVVILFK